MDGGRHAVCFASTDIGWFKGSNGRVQVWVNVAVLYVRESFDECLHSRRLLRTCGGARRRWWLVQPDDVVSG